jgi:hypothetical protein
MAVRTAELAAVLAGILLRQSESQGSRASAQLIQTESGSRSFDSGAAAAGEHAREVGDGDAVGKGDSASAGRVRVRADRCRRCVILAAGVSFGLFITSPAHASRGRPPLGVAQHSRAATRHQSESLVAAYEASSARQPGRASQPDGPLKGIGTNLRELAPR